MKKIVLSIFTAAIFSFAATAAAQSNQCADHLFYVGKSDNANVAYYDANLVNGRFDRRNPITVYWIMYAERGQREGLTMLERPHFGVNTRELTEGERHQVNIRQSMLSSKDMILAFENGCPVITLNIGGVQSYIRNVFIQISPDSGLLPTVEHIDINGVSVRDGTPTTERVVRR